jgi:hypothetical protein
MPADPISQQLFFVVKDGKTSSKPRAGIDQGDRNIDMIAIGLAHNLVGEALWV